MKKIFIIAACAFGLLNANAEDILQVTPGKVVANLTENEWEESFDVELVNTREFTALQFDLYLPEGMTLIENGPMDLSEDRFEGKIVKKQWTPNATAEVTPKETGHYLITLYHADLEKIKGNSGTLLTFYYLTDSSMKPGCYPVVIKNTVLSVTATDDVQIPCSTSYVTIEGTPEVTSLALEGTIPSFVTTALAAETAISSLDLTNVTAVNGEFTYVDGRDVTAPEDLAATAKYAKTVADGKYSSLTLPFDATFEANTAYKLSGVENGYASFESVTSANAGDVVLLTKSISLTGAKLGSVATEVKDEAYYVAPDGSELHHGTNVTVPALRGSWNIQASSNLRIALDGVLTDINLIDVEGEGAKVFDLQGRQAQNATNGVFVVNGKKQFVK